MSQATNSAIDRQTITEMAREIGVSEPEALVEHAITEGIFYLDEDGKVASARVIDDKSSLALKRSKGKTRKRQQRDRERDSSVTPDTDSEVLNNKKEEESFTAELAFPDSTPPDVADACRRWQKSRWKNHRKRFEQIELEALLISYGTRYAELLVDLNAAVTGGWRNVQPSGHASVTPLSQPKPLSLSRRNARETAAKLEDNERNKCDKPVEEVLNEEQKSKLQKLKGGK
jgi:hypothetical protein